LFIRRSFHAGWCGDGLDEIERAGEHSAARLRRGAHCRTAREGARTRRWLQRRR
jgi:hypothetical protein